MKNKANQGDFLAKCSVCGSSLAPADIIVLNEKEQKTTVHVTCAKCQSAAIVFLLNNQLGMVSVGMATDLDGVEAISKFSSDSINSDDIIDLYQLISSENGNIVQLIKDYKS